MLLPGKMANRMSMIIRKGTKYYPIILENKGAYVFGTLCAVQIVVLKEKCNGSGKDSKRLSIMIKGRKLYQMKSH